MQDNPKNKHINYESDKRLAKKLSMSFNELVNDMDYDIDHGNFSPNYVDYSDRFESWL